MAVFSHIEPIKNCDIIQGDINGDNGGIEVFCSEEILAVYKCIQESNGLSADSFLDYYHDLAYHVTKGVRIVLETAHYYISLGVTGAKLSEKKATMDGYVQSGEDYFPFTQLLEDEAPWIYYESTLFVGERLNKVKTTDNGYLLHFDDFKLKLVPHEPNEKNFPYLDKDNSTYNHIYGAERHLKRKCECGGEGELLLDTVSDYIVRCRKCKKSTWAQMTAQDAIDEWNAGELKCDLSGITIK